MDQISVEGIRIYAYHGCLEEEGRIGTEYQCDVNVWGDLQSSYQSDKLEHTIDYVTINQIVERHVSQRAKLIETVAFKIIKDLFLEVNRIATAEIRLCKMHPPINGDVNKVCIQIKRNREDFTLQ